MLGCHLLDLHFAGVRVVLPATFAENVLLHLRALRQRQLLQLLLIPRHSLPLRRRGLSLPVFVGPLQGVHELVLLLGLLTDGIGLGLPTTGWRERGGASPNLVAGLLPPERPLVAVPPFRAPHHGASAAAMIGGGTVPRPGEVSLAHRGVLFMDELPEFPRPVLEALRQPLEDGVVSIARVGGRALFPARFALVGAMNLCPCGGRGDPALACTCAPSRVAAYREKLSRALLDRFDLR